MEISDYEVAHPRGNSSNAVSYHWSGLFTSHYLLASFRHLQLVVFEEDCWGYWLGVVHSYQPNQTNQQNNLQLNFNSMIHTLINGLLVEVETVTEIHVTVTKKYKYTYPKPPQPLKTTEDDTITSIMREVFEDLKQRGAK